MKLSEFLYEETSEGAAVGPPSEVSVSDLFEEEPCDLTAFVQDSWFLNNPALSQIQYDAVRHIERIYYSELYAQMALAFNSAYWKEPVRLTNLITIQAGKGCVVKGTEVYNARNGQWQAIEELPLDAIMQGIDSRNEDASTEHLPGAPALRRGSHSSFGLMEGGSFKRGYGNCVRITTNSGGQIDVFEKHLFTSWESNELPYKNRYSQHVKPVWKYARDLEVNDRLAVISKLECARPIAQDPREVELVGYWIGDGSMPVDSSKQWAFYIDSDPVADDLRERYTKLVNSYPGISAKYEIMPSGTMRIRATQAVGSKTINPLMGVIIKHGMYGKRAWDKRVPSSFFSLPDDQLAIFLSALWDTDGSVYWKKQSGGTSAPGLEYCTSSEGLARDIQRLLYRFGVISRLTSAVKSYTYKGEKKQGRVSWRISVTADQYAQKLLSILNLHGEKEYRRTEMLEHVCYAGQQVLDGDVYWDKIKSIEPLGQLEYWDMTVPKTGTYVAGSISILNSNSGKDHICRIASLRIAYLLLCLKSPQEYFGMPSQDTIHLLNIAANAQQANAAFFEPMTKAVRNGWFKDKCEPKQNEIVYAKNINAISGNSDAENQEGLNLILGVADEIDAFRSKEELERHRGKQAREPTRSAEAILKMLMGSASTRFPETFKNVRISYPRYKGSMIQQLTFQGSEDIRKRGIEKSRHYVSGPHTTWDVNPRYDKFERISIPQTEAPIPNVESIVNHYEENPEEAKAIYECIPSLAIDGFFKNHDAVRACMNDDLAAMQAVTVEYEFIPIQSEVTGQIVSSWNPIFRYRDEFVPIEGANYCIHADMALNGDRAGLAMSHVVKYDQVVHKTISEDGTEGTTSYMRPVLKTDFVLYFEADMRVTPRREIQQRWARILVFDLMKRGFKIAMFSQDGWQSLDSLQMLELHGIEIKKFSLDKDDSGYKTLKDVIYESRTTIPYSDLLYKELIGLGRFGAKIDHAIGSSKDCADAVAGSTYMAIEVGGMEDDDGARAYYDGLGLPLDTQDKDLYPAGAEELRLPPGFTMDWDRPVTDYL